MITVKDIEFLADFYNKINLKNGNKINLNAFVEEEGVAYSFQEDVVDNLVECITRFSQIINSMKTINTDKEINDLVFDRAFVENTVELYKLFGELSVVFDDFQKLETQITKSLPEGPEDDSELI